MSKKSINLSSMVKCAWALWKMWWELAAKGERNWLLKHVGLTPPIPITPQDFWGIIQGGQYDPVWLFPCADFWICADEFWQVGYSPCVRAIIINTHSSLCQLHLLMGSPWRADRRDIAGPRKCSSPSSLSACKHVKRVVCCEEHVWAYSCGWFWVHPSGLFYISTFAFVSFLSYFLSD